MKIYRSVVIVRSVGCEYDFEETPYVGVDYIKARAEIKKYADSLTRSTMQQALIETWEDGVYICGEEVEKEWYR